MKRCHAGPGSCCHVFLLAALTPALVLMWLILGLTGLFGPL